MSGTRLHTFSSDLCTARRVVRARLLLHKGPPVAGSVLWSGLSSPSKVHTLCTHMAGSLSLSLGIPPPVKTNTWPSVRARRSPFRGRRGAAETHPLESIAVAKSLEFIRSLD